MSVRTASPPATPSRPRRSLLRRTLGWAVALVLVAVVVVPLTAAGLVVLGARTDDRTPTDAIVVLGAAQFWGRPSPVLETRLEHGAQLFDEDVAPRVITVGGKQPGDVTTEAQAGKEWLVEDGVPRTRISAVPTGSDTLTSLEAVAELMAEKGWQSATIVTDPVHEARSLAMARALGIDAHGSPTQSGAGSSVTLDYVVRETGGLLYFWFVQRREL